MEVNFACLFEIEVAEIVNQRDLFFAVTKIAAKDAPPFVFARHLFARFTSLPIRVVLQSEAHGFAVAAFLVALDNLSQQQELSS